MTQLGLFEGRKRRDEGIKKVASNNDRLLFLLRERAKQISDERGYVTTDDLRAFAQERGHIPTDNHFWGSVLRGKGWIEIGRTPSAIEGNHARRIGKMRWVG